MPQFKLPKSNFKYTLTAFKTPLIKKFNLSKYYSIEQPIVRVSNLQINEAAKAPESAWKLVFYLTAWSYSAYILFGTQYTFFNNPQNIFKSLFHLFSLAINVCLKIILCLPYLHQQKFIISKVLSIALKHFLIFISKSFFIHCEI